MVAHKTMHFADDKALYLILNIIGHDVIHDYGPGGASEERWKKNQETVAKFSDNFTFSGVSGGEKSKRLPKSTKKAHPFSKKLNLIVTPKPYSKRKNLKAYSKLKNLKPYSYDKDLNIKDDYLEYLHAVTELKTILANNIIFTFFCNVIIFTSTINPDILTNTYNITDLVTYTVQSADASYLSDSVYIDVVNKFLGYINKKNPITSIDIENFLILLCTFLSDIAFEQVIFENIKYKLPLKRQRKNKGLLPSAKIFSYSTTHPTFRVGGAANPDVQLDSTESASLIHEVEKLLNSNDTIDILNILDAIYNEYNTTSGDIKTDITVNLINGTTTTITANDCKNTYETYRKELIELFRNIFKRYKQFKKADGLYGNVDTIRSLIVGARSFKISFTSSARLSASSAAFFSSLAAVLAALASSFM
jgi:hypothetical protein